MRQNRTGGMEVSIKEGVRHRNWLSTKGITIAKKSRREKAESPLGNTLLKKARGRGRENGKGRKETQAR